MIIQSYYPEEKCHNHIYSKWSVLFHYEGKLYFFVFFFQAEDGIRDAQESRGLEMCIRDRTTGVSPSTSPNA